MSSTTYGFIACTTAEDGYYEAVKVIDSLPESGQMIVRHLFHVIPHSRGFSYYMNMITFGMDQKDDWCIDADFIEQFEKLLVRLDWSHAELIHTWTGTRVVWQRKRADESTLCERNEFERTSFGSVHDLRKIEL